MENKEERVRGIAESLRGSGKTFAEFLVEVFKDKFVEIYLGDEYESVSVEQISTPYPAVFCGKVVAAYKECLVISCVYVNEQKKMQTGNLLFINERAIRALDEIDGNGVLQDLFWRSADSKSLVNKLGA